MTETIEISIADPYAAMLDELRAADDAEPDKDLTQLVQDAIHNGYQQAE